MTHHATRLRAAAVPSPRMDALGREARQAWRARLILAAIVASLLGASPVVAAHPPDAHGSLSSDPAAGTAPAGSLAGVVLLYAGAFALPLLLAAPRPRRLLPVVTAALLVGFAGETALHSAHHLGDPAGAEQCPAFSASQHLPALGLEGGTPIVDSAVPAARLVVGPVARPPAVVSDQLQPRAPPVPPA